MSSKLEHRNSAAALDVGIGASTGGIQFSRRASSAMDGGNMDKGKGKSIIDMEALKQEMDGMREEELLAMVQLMRQRKNKSVREEKEKRAMLEEEGVEFGPDDGVGSVGTVIEDKMVEQDLLGLNNEEVDIDEGRKYFGNKASSNNGGNMEFRNDNGNINDGI